MPRIRKKTSKRGTTHQRVRVKHKVAESRKKAKKEAKKNIQWTSKHKKDPGIPNNFPFKDQILAELAAQRRQEGEEKLRRKEQRKAEKTAANVRDAEKDQVQDDASGFDGISSVGVSALKASEKSQTVKGKERLAVVEGDDENVPILMNSEYTTLRSVLDKVDVVLQILDAKEPIACQSTHLQEYVKGKGKTLLVLNKIDTCPRETVQTWATTLRKQHPTHLFRSASAFLPKIEEQNSTTVGKSSEAPSLFDAEGVDSLLEALAVEAGKKSDEPFLVALVGVANTGKSSLFNSLLKKSISPVYRLTSTPSGPSTTERPLQVTLEYEGKQIILIDTPALSWETLSDLDGSSAPKLRATDMLLRNKGRIDRAKDAFTLVSEIVARANTEDLMLFYTLPAFAPGDVTAFLSALARVKGLIKRRGAVDLAGAARVVLRDWSTGRLPRFAQPTRADTGAVNSEDGVACLYAADEEILKAAPTRKEMRKGRGIIRLVPCEVETRNVTLDVSWDAENDSEDEEMGEERAQTQVKQDGDDEKENQEENEESEGDDEVENEADKEDLSSPSRGKRKRQEKSEPASASKKVTFAAHPKGSKQARTQRPSKTAKASPAGKAKRSRK